MVDGAEQGARGRLRRTRAWTVVAGAILIALAAGVVGMAIWWGSSVDWNLSARVDTPQLTDPSLAVLLFGGIGVGFVFAVAGAWTLVNALRSARRRG